MPGGRHLVAARDGRLDIRTELGRLVALIGATGIALAQPLLDALGRSPETFVYHRVEGADLVLFAIGLVLVPPLVLWGVGLLVGRFAPRWRAVVHGASIGGLIAVALLQLLRSQPRPVALVVALLAGVAGWVLVVGSSGFRMWTRYLAVVTPLALLSFVLLSPSSELVTGQSFQAAARGGDRPVVLVVLDELPTASILTPDGRIDAVRFPNLARFAQDATWYRNNTTLNGFTTQAVPSIFDGQVPQDVSPLFTEHPDNLFRALAGTHDLVVSEALTRLCPVSVCGSSPQPPSGARPSDEAGSDLAGMLRDATHLLWGRVTGRQGVELGGFSEREEDVAQEFDGPDQGPAVDDFYGTAIGAQPARLTSFLDALQPSGRPVAAVIHLVSPHFPWTHLPSGETYAETAPEADLPIDGAGDPWVAELERQRHLLQASYTDRLLGAVLDRVREEGWYDDAAIVVTADHGISFHGDENRRLPVPAALPEIMWAPLLVKAPGQSEPRVDDSNAQSIDIVPTIASLVHATLPWKVDGLVLGSKAQVARGATKPFRRFTDAADPYPSSDLAVDGDELFPKVLALAPLPISSDEDPAAALARHSDRPDLIGQPLAATGSAPEGLFHVDLLDRLLGSEARVLVLTGTVDGDIGADHVVAAVDGRIVAVSPVIHRNIGGAAFAMLLPAGGPKLDLHDVELALLHGDERLTTGPLGG